MDRLKEVRLRQRLSLPLVPALLNISGSELRVSNRWPFSAEVL